MIGQNFKQKCGDSLKIIEELKDKNNRTVYKGTFQKYPYEVIKSKQEIINGTVNNPEIERIEFLEKQWPQKCGDILCIIDKSENFKKNRKYRCKFIKYPIEIEAYKCNILKGEVENPCIEEKEFIGKEFKQNCGDTLLVLEKTTIQKNQRYLFRCQFQKYPYEILVEKQRIIRGSVLNPKIEEQNFIGKEIRQNCGDILRVIEKSDKSDGKNVLYKCKFLNYPSIVYERKGHILDGEIINPNLPWKSKEGLIKYINKNFKEKPTIKELSNKLEIAESTLCQIVIKFEIQNYIQYFISDVEKQIREFCLQNNSSTEKVANLKILEGQEIDIYLPDLKLGIEYNGNLWHSNHPKFGKQDYLYHQKKSLLAQEKGVFLLHIWEWEWNSKQNIILGLLKSKLGIFDKKIGASKCKIKVLSNQEYQNFCNENHLQGTCAAKVKYGLFYKEELVQVMSFGCPRFNSDYQWEIIRECSKLGYIILGGKEKLWKRFLKDYSPNNCISYCDFSKFNGYSYIKLGFKKERLNKPGFIWFDVNSKQIYQRTPWKHNEYKNFLKLYDCGQLVFSWVND